jgi:hypothetical protein
MSGVAVGKGVGEGAFSKGISVGEFTGQKSPSEGKLQELIPKTIKPSTINRMMILVSVLLWLTFSCISILFTFSFKEVTLNHRFQIWKWDLHGINTPPRST